MEALIAVGLAGNVVQFIQGAGTLIAQANAIRESSSPSSLPGLQRLCKTLTDQAAVLRTRLKACSATLKEEDQNLLDLAAECEEAGTQFIIYLESLTSQSSSNLVRTVRTAVKFHLSKHEIDDFVAILDRLRGSLTLATVLAFRTSSENSNDEILGHLKAIQQDHKARNLEETDIWSAVQMLTGAVQDHPPEDSSWDAQSSSPYSTRPASRVDADIEPQYVEMKKAFERLMEKSRFLKLAIFIDGIDEFGGDHRDMALFLRSLASLHVKLVVSSRPLNACLDALAGCPNLRLQELTRPDMEKFVQGELSSNRLMARMMKQFPKRAPKLIIDLLNKAEGAFLWVKLVVRLLVDGLENGDTLEELHAKLTLLPFDLRDLYRNMFGKMRIEYQKQAAVIFQLLHQWRHSILDQNLPGLVLSYAMYPSTAVFEAPVALMTGEAFNWTMSTLDKRIRSRCCGLLELRYNDNTLAGWPGVMNIDNLITIADGDRGVVTYLHRTVAEFIAASEVWQEVCELTNDMAFDCNSSLASACLSMMWLANRFNDHRLRWYLEVAAGFCRKATTTEPYVIQQYVLEMDSIMSVFHGRSLSIHGERPCIHWSVSSHRLNLNGVDPAVDNYASIHTFAAGQGILAHLRLLPLNADHEGRFAIVLHALSIWKNKLLHKEIAFEEASGTLSYLLHNVSSPESVAFNTSLWQQALFLCKNMQESPGHDKNLAAAQLLKVFLSAISSPQSLLQTSRQAWQSAFVDPTHVLNRFITYTNANPSKESKALLHDLERLTGTQGKRYGDAGVDRKGSNSQSNHRHEKKSRRNKKIKRRANGGQS
ncbi:unnamed protein product [Alternaria alternata]